MQQLKEGEINCPKCNGKGFLYDNDDKCDNVRSCEKCRGYGKFDWLEIMFGKRLDSFVFHFTTPMSKHRYSYPIRGEL